MMMETLGCSGTIFKHKKQNDEVHFMLVSEIEDKDILIFKKVYNKQIQDIKILSV